MLESKHEHESLLQSEMQESRMNTEGELAQYREEIAQLKSVLEVAEVGATRQSELESEVNTLNLNCSDLEEKIGMRVYELETVRAEFMNKTATYEAELTHSSTRVQQLERELSEFKKDDTTTIEDQVEAEMAQTTLAVDQAALRIQEILEASKNKLSGIKLEVNGNILGACTGLMAAIKLLIEKSKHLQREIISEGGEHSSKEFYRKNHRWTEGLISAAKIVGQGATYLVETADRCVDGRASYQELMVVSKDISASTVQLVVTSQVKADKESGCLKDVKGASSKVSECVGQVIASAQVGAHQIEENEEIDFTNLSYVRAKKLERDMSINVLELESKLEKARLKLMNLRKSTYHTSEGATGDIN
ncbi:Huntingtin-interacting protein 1-like isoform X2 [Oopsacas minuta]|uniref:Huntingtin-interacting protein 1-like isoform X2 n=1 Tax=Oopsacas minuta TaxID=111878 RepID=A0AAV7K768_9METZ|nr:Huntingtin-interacting protein 1-like isoform X2 [Oopsacas minuta]